MKFIVPSGSCLVDFSFYRLTGRETARPVRSIQVIPRVNSLDLALCPLHPGHSVLNIELGLRQLRTRRCPYLGLMAQQFLLNLLMTWNMWTCGETW
jgi:hypothetical protein